jgi:hypothetical protein
MKPEKLNFIWKLSDVEQRQVGLKKLKIIAPYGLMGQMEMKCIFKIGEKNSILAKTTQVSDVAHGALVL